jgi:hypothetical protein
LGPSARAIIELRQRVLEEEALIRQAGNGAETASAWCLNAASEAEYEARRLRWIDPRKSPKKINAYLEIDESVPGDPGPAQSIWKVTTNGRQIVAINDRPLVQTDDAGREIRVDGHRVRVDGVVIDDNDQPIPGIGRRPPVVT